MGLTAWHRDGKLNPQLRPLGLHSYRKNWSWSEYLFCCRKSKSSLKIRVLSTGN